MNAGRLFFFAFDSTTRYFSASPEWAPLVSTSSHLFSASCDFDSDSTDSTVQTPFSDSTVQTVYSNSIVQTPFSDSTFQTVYSDSTIQTVYSNSTVQTPFFDSTVQTVYSNSTDYTVFSTSNSRISRPSDPEALQNFGCRRGQSLQPETS
jgi:hypothetical protein